jgi:acyl-CoA thioester hydrolase
MAGKEFVWDDRVRIYDTDSQGIVHYAGYYRFFTNAFEQFSRERLGSEFPLVSERVWFVVVESNAKYYKPARLGDKLRTHVHASILGKKAMRFDFRIHRGNDVLCDGYVVQVAIDRRRWKAVAIPQGITRRLEKLR